MPLKATERDVYEFFSRAGKVGAFSPSQFSEISWASCIQTVFNLRRIFPYFHFVLS